MKFTQFLIHSYFISFISLHIFSFPAEIEVAFVLNFFRWTFYSKFEVKINTATDFLILLIKTFLIFPMQMVTRCSLLENRHIKSKTHLNCRTARANFANDKAKMNPSSLVPRRSLLRQSPGLTAPRTPRDQAGTPLKTEENFETPVKID